MKKRKSDKRIKARQADFERIPALGAERNGKSKWGKTEGGKTVMFHRPGAPK